jgi:hypothetical protein
MIKGPEEGEPIAEIPSNPPFAKGGRGDFWEFFSEDYTVVFFQRAKV